MRKHIDPSGGNVRGQVLTFPRAASASGHVRKIPSSVVASLITVLLIAAAGSVAWLAAVKPYSVRYTTMPLTRGSVVRAVAATGTVNPEFTVTVGSQVSGVIQSLYCNYNTKVRKGQICAKIDPRPYQAAIDQFTANLGVAKAQLEKDRASLAYAKIRAERDARPVETTAPSRDAADNTRSVFEQMQAQTALDQAIIAQIEAQLEAARVNLGYTDVVSPMDGTVVSLNVAQGQAVAPSIQAPPLFLIATDLAKMQVDTNVTESSFGGVKLGNEASFTVDAFPNRTFDGVVSQVHPWPQKAQNVVSYDVVLGVDNSDLALAPGMTASTRIVLERRNEALRVPDVALRYVPEGLGQSLTTRSQQSDPDGAHLWMLRNGEPTAVSVILGLDDGQFTEIVKGELRPGDQVVVSEQQGEGAGSALPVSR